MVGVAEKKLSVELFSDGNLHTLKQLLAESVRPKLPPPIEKFIQQVEGILGKVEALETGVKISAGTGHAPETDKFISSGKTAAGKLPQDVGFSYILGSSISGLPESQQGRIVGYALKIIGERPTSEPYSYKRLRSYEIFIDTVTALIGKHDLPPGLFCAVDKINAGSEDAVFNFATALEKVAVNEGSLYKFLGVQTKDRATATKKPAPRQQITKPEKQSDAAANAHATSNTPPGTQAAFYRQPAPGIEPYSAAHYLSRLEIAIQGLEKKEQDIVRSYANRLAGADKILGQFVERFTKITYLSDAPAELYDVMGGLDANDTVKLNDFNTKLLGASGRFDMLVALSDFVPSRYARRVKDITDIYREDPELVSIFKDRDGFHMETINARNKIPAVRVGQFYETIKKIPGDVSWGNRYNGLIQIVRDNQANAVRFIEWASCQQGAFGAKFDSEMRKHNIYRFSGVRL